MFLHSACNFKQIYDWVTCNIKYVWRYRQLKITFCPSIGLICNNPVSAIHSIAGTAGRVDMIEKCARDRSFAFLQIARLIGNIEYMRRFHFVSFQKRTVEIVFGSSHFCRNSKCCSVDCELFRRKLYVTADYSYVQEDPNEIGGRLSANFISPLQLGSFQQLLQRPKSLESGLRFY